jgi:hypothetical protein
MLTSGTATVGTVGRHSFGVSATDASGGAEPLNYQWQWSWPRDGLGWRDATGDGVSGLSAVIKDLGPAARYQLRLQYTDAASTVVYSNTLTASTRPLGWFWRPWLWQRET